jgi:hypothetical protein
MPLLFSALAKTKELIQVTFRQLPLFLIGTLFILGLMETNTAYLFLVIGSFVCMALIWFLQALLSFIVGKANNQSITNFFMSSAASMQGCSILGLNVDERAAAIAGEKTIVTPSYYIGFISFFFTYVFRNAYDLYNRTPDEVNNSKEAQEKIDNRKYQAGMTMAFCIVFFLLFAMVRILKFSGCEMPPSIAGRIIGFVFTTGIGIGIANSWYSLLHQCGGDVLSDLFGIIGRIVPTNAADSNPVACVVST